MEFEARGESVPGRAGEMQEKPGQHPMAGQEEAKPTVKTSRPRRLAARLYRLVRGGLALAMLLQIILICTPLTDGLQNWLNVTEPVQPADMIVCLGGGDHRVLWAADLFRRGFAPQVIVSNKPGAAHKMRDLLVLCGVPASRVLLDTASATTGDHPAGVAALPGIDPANQRFLIVTDREHSRRAAACFRRAGYQHFTVYAGRPAGATASDQPRRWRERVFILPYLAYEYAALLKYRLQGKI